MSLHFINFICNRLMSCKNSSQFDAACNLNRIEGSISTTFKSLYETVQINAKINPHTLPWLRARVLNKEGFFLKFLHSRWQHNPTLGLHNMRCTLVKSLTASSICQSPANSTCKLRYCWLHYVKVYSSDFYQTLCS